LAGVRCRVGLVWPRGLCSENSIGPVAAVWGSGARRPDSLSLGGVVSAGVVDQSAFDVDLQRSVEAIDDAQGRDIGKPDKQLAHPRRVRDNRL
jgi:hypothetical protein